MLAVVNTPQASAPVTIEEVAAPSAASNEALVRVQASSVNRGELALLKARPYGWRPGQDVAGIVEEAAADGSGPPVGTRVLGIVEDAGWAQYVSVPTDQIAVLGHTVSFEQAATLPLAGLAALRTLRYGADLLGRRVLITGASGGVGRLQVQLAARRGAEVIAVASPGHAKGLLVSGASAVVSDVREASGLFDLITESVGGTALAAAISRIKPHGVIVIFGASSGEKTPISLYDFLGHENVTIHVFMSYASPHPFGPDLQILADLVAAERLHPHIAHTAAWSDLAPALAALQQRRIHGKVVITID
ncbi:MAG: oxidoreductase [Acidimicrobiales bacterium]|nr:MAG: oxidoreductase [Acidimicrobiales bacterium]